MYDEATDRGIRLKPHYTKTICRSFEGVRVLAVDHVRKALTIDRRGEAFVCPEFYAH